MVSQALQQAQRFGNTTSVGKVPMSTMRQILADAESKGLDKKNVIKRMLDKGMELEGFGDNAKDLAINKLSNQYLSPEAQQSAGGRIAGKLIDYEGLGGPIIRGAGTTLAGLIGGAESVGKGLEIEARRGDEVNAQAIKNDVIMARFKEKYGRLPNLSNQEDKRLIKPILMDVEDDEMYQTALSSATAEQATIDEKTVAENLLDIGEGGLTAGFTITTPGFMYALNTIGENKYGAMVLDKVGDVIQLGGSVVTELPVLSQWRDALPEERRGEFDEFIGNAALVALLHVRERVKAGESPVKVAKENIKADTLIKEFEAKKLEKPTEVGELEMGFADKILQPGKREIKLGEADRANRGLMNLVREGKVSDYTYQGLKNSVKEPKKTTFNKLIDGLKKADDNVTKSKTEVYGTALKGLKEVIGDEATLSPTLKKISKEIDNLTKKFEGEGLSLLERQKIKQLHTEYNRLFTESGKETAGFSAENLRQIREAIKSDIEMSAKKGGFKDVELYNTQYGEYLALETALKDQAASARAIEGKLQEMSMVQEGISKIMNIPGVKEIGLRPMQTALQELLKERGTKTMSSAEVQKVLPKMLKKLENQAVKKTTITKIKDYFSKPVNIKNINKLLEAVAKGEIGELSD